MAWRLLSIHRKFRFPSCPPAAAGVFPSAGSSCVLHGSTQFLAKCQSFSIAPMYLENSKHYRRRTDTCSWGSRNCELSFLRALYARGSTATGTTDSVCVECVALLHSIHSSAVVLGPLRCFGTQRVVQKRRHQMRILHPLQAPYIHCEGRPRPCPIPHSLTVTGTIKRLLNSNSIAAKEAASRINWEAYISHKKGVRWHPQGAWRVQFSRRNYERNFFVRCECYFKVSDYGFETAKELAVWYRERLEKEWEELQQQWNRLDIAEARDRVRHVRIPTTATVVETQH